MTEVNDLLNVPAFAGLPVDQIEWFLSRAQSVRFQAGDILMNGGDPADAMFVLLEGQIVARGEINGETMVFTIDPGAVTGPTAFFTNEDLHAQHSCHHGRPHSAISGNRVSRTCAENAGVDRAPRRHDD